MFLLGVTLSSLHCTLSLAAQCIVISSVCNGWCNGRQHMLLALFVGLLPQLKIASIDLHQTGSVGEGSDHLQLIKFWLSCAPGKGICGGVKIFASALLQPACSVCVFLIIFYFFCRIGTFVKRCLYFICISHICCSLEIFVSVCQWYFHNGVRW